MTWQATVRAGGSFKRRGHDQALFRNLPFCESAGYLTDGLAEPTYEVCLESLHISGQSEDSSDNSARCA